MNVISERFCSLIVGETDILEFPEGIPPFPAELTKWVLLSTDETNPLLWLHSAQDSTLALVVCNPQSFLTDYRLELGPGDMQMLGLQPGDDVETLAVVTARPTAEETTVNLLAPLVLIPSTRIGAQAINLAEDYPLRGELLALLNSNEVPPPTLRPQLPIVAAVEHGS